MSATRTLTYSLCTLALALASRDASASNYPPDYDVCGVNETAYTGPFEVIRDLVDLWDEHVKLTVAYDGYLRDLYPDDQINIYISINGNDAFIEAYPGAHDDAYIFLDSGPRACSYCYPGSPYSHCQSIEWPPGSSGKWVCGQPTEIEEHMFYWAFNDNGQMNAWDIELAAEANGQWDSNYGSNYEVRLEPRGCW